MKRMLLAAAFGGLILTSCNSASSEEKYVPKDGMLSKSDTVPASVSSTVQNNSPVVQQPVATLQNGQVVNPNMITTSIPSNTPGMTTTRSTVQAPVQPAQATTTAPGMNPPHGQPGHRCEIAVGAPLNSKPVAQPVVQQQQPVQATMSQQPVAPTAPGMNPPHGQPGHRCEIAVGAPLNSAPAVKKDSTKQ